MGTKTKTKTNETQTAAPPSWTMPGISDLAGQVNAKVAGLDPNAAYKGDFIAQPGVLDQGIAQGYQGNADISRMMSLPALGAVGMNATPASFATNDLGNQGFGSYDASAIQPVIQAAIQPYMRQLQEQVLPGLQSAGIESGAYGGTRAMETLPGMAIRDSGRQMQELSTQIALNDFQNQQQRQQQAYGMASDRGLGEAGTLTQRLGQLPDLLDTVMRMQTGATEMDVQAAAYDRALRQSELDNAFQRQQYGVQAPFEGMGQAASLLGQLSGNYGTTTRTGTTTQSTGGAGQVMQGALGLGMMGLSAFAPGAGSAGGGALSSLFKRAPSAAMTTPFGFGGK